MLLECSVLSKAFDGIDHETLVRKLSHYEIKTQALSDRTQVPNKIREINVDRVKFSESRTQTSSFLWATFSYEKLFHIKSFFIHLFDLILHICRWHFCYFFVVIDRFIIYMSEFRGIAIITVPSQCIFVISTNINTCILKTIPCETWAQQPTKQLPFLILPT